jgi:hypothetical protein
MITNQEEGGETGMRGRRERPGCGARRKSIGRGKDWRSSREKVEKADRGLKKKQPDQRS